MNTSLKVDYYVTGQGKIVLNSKQFNSLHTLKTRISKESKRLKKGTVPSVNLPKGKLELLGIIKPKFKRKPPAQRQVLISTKVRRPRKNIGSLTTSAAPSNSFFLDNEVLENMDIVETFENQSPSTNIDSFPSSSNENEIRTTFCFHCNGMCKVSNFTYLQ